MEASRGSNAGDSVREAPSGPWTVSRLTAELDRRWIALTLAAWFAVGIYLVWQRWGAIHWLALGDTDDNMRLMQVRALLGGQDWYDLRQYRLNPPAGFDIHWSRIVDLPIAGLILLFRLFMSPDAAERWAIGIAPILPLSLTMIGVAATVRRLVHPLAWPLGLIFFLCAAATLLMFVPTRIDHHGWQLAMLSLTVAGLCDPARARGGALVGAASAVSLNIGLELLPYAAMAGAIITLRWVWDRAEARRLAVYAATLGGGSAAGFAGFASYANRALRCDALTPVWLSVLVVGGALLLLLALASPARREVRFGLALAAGAIIAAGFAWLFPQCLGRPEQVSPELARTWLDNVREAKPIYKHPLKMLVSMTTLPIIGVIGGWIAVWRARRTPQLGGWAVVALFTTFAAAMLLWQARAGPAAQLLSIAGVTALGWWLLPKVLNSPHMLVRVFGTVGGFLLVSGLFAGLLVPYLPGGTSNAYTKRVNRAGGRCTTVPALRALDRYPAQTIFTFVDLGPRLITVSHHSAVAGPYHRNGGAILDVHHAFGRSPAEARVIMKRHGATMLVVCPNMAESTIYRSRNPGGFYDQLAHNRVPAWLNPLPLPKGSPLRAFRIN
jgi:hypothetical protein